MAAWNSGKGRPKSSLPKLQSRPGSGERIKTSTLSFQRTRSPDDCNANLSLKEVTDIPGTVRVCSGTYFTHSQQRISSGTKLYLHKKVQRRVVQFKYCYPKTTHLVNVSLNSNIHVGFKHSNINFQNVNEVIRQRTLPKVLCVVNSCLCNELHCPISKSDVLLVLSSEKRALVVRNVSTQVTQKLPRKCSASFTTDPPIACVLVKDLEFLPQDSLPWADVVPKESPIHESPQRNQSMKIENIFPEDCFKVQVAGGTEMHLLPLDAHLEVVPISSDDHEFPKSPYEVIERDILNQPTIMEYPRKGSYGTLSRPSSAKSSTSSMQSNSSSLPLIPESPLTPEFTTGPHSLEPQLELNIMNLHFQTREVTKVSTFGIYLGIPPYIVETSEEEFPHNIERRRMGLLIYWLKTNVKASWDDVLKALEMMGENRICEKIKWKIRHVEESDGVQLPPIYYDNIVDKEQEIKENFMKLEGELHDMREQLQFLENLNMFQKPASGAQKQDLFEMGKRVKIIELDIQKYLIEREKLSGPSKESADVCLKSPDLTYYNALPLNNHRYIPKLWVSEEETLRVELKEKKAQQTVLEEGKGRCEEQLAELTTCTDSVSSHSDIFERCYHMRLTLNCVIYKHKLAVLRVKEEELQKKIRELKEEREAESLRFCPKQDHHSDLLPKQLQHHKGPQMHIQHPVKTKPLPVPRGLQLLSSPPDRKNLSLQTQKDSLKMTQDPRTAPSVEQTKKPIPRPRKRTEIKRSYSQEDAYETEKTHSPTKHLPNIVPRPPLTQRPMTSGPLRNRQKPPVPPRCKTTYLNIRHVTELH